MSKSTRLLTATYILSYVAARAPEVVTTEHIAEQVDEHPTRVRQIVAALVKSGLLSATRGAAGGVSLARPATEISLHDIQTAVQDGSLLALHLFEPKSEWAGKSSVHLVFENLRDELQQRIDSYLGQHTLDQTYTPIVVPFSAGGTTDILAHTLSEHLGPELGAPALVERSAGQRRAAAAASDTLRPHMTRAEVGGSTLYVMTVSGVIAEALGGQASTTAFEPVTLLAESEMVLAVSASSKAHSVADLVRLARTAAARGKHLRFASVGEQSVSHLSAELFCRAAGVALEHVVFSGAQPAVQALMAGEVDLYFGTPPTFLPHLRSGQLRALATTAAQRAAALPDLPRMSDTYPGFDVVGWHAVFAPAGTPPAAIKRLRARIVEVMSLADVKSRLHRQGFKLVVSTPAELAARVEQDIARWRLLAAAPVVAAPKRPRGATSASG